MRLLSPELSLWAYRIDFAFYSAVVLLLALSLLGAPWQDAPALALLVLLGLAGWTLIEYISHRFISHGSSTLAHWHGQHHTRPMALICLPTLMGAALFALLIFVPAWLLLPHHAAAALCLGVMLGYLLYSITHHATHHWRARSAWLQERKRWHALHHHHGQLAYFGVSCTFWDRLLGTAGPR
jgi:sterol desaturase/sphingolipid hydroxylase (fatty acid hydroxylase superfamily)